MQARRKLCVARTRVNGQTVNCTLGTNNQNGATGYGTTNDTNDIYNIQAGATVTGTNFGFLTNEGGTFNDLGTIRPGAAGISTNNGSTTVHNQNTITGGQAGFASVGTLVLDSTGTVSGTAAGSIGVDVNTINLTANTGLITGVRAGILINHGTNIISNANSIFGSGTTGAGIEMYRDRA